jgi:hypothetical protein
VEQHTFHCTTCAISGTNSQKKKSQYTTTLQERYKVNIPLTFEILFLLQAKMVSALFVRRAVTLDTEFPITDVNTSTVTAKYFALLCAAHSGWGVGWVGGDI